MNEKKIILEELEEYINKVSYLKEDINLMKKKSSRNIKLLAFEV